MRTKLILLLMMLPFAMNSQNGRFREKREQIKSLKIAFITNELKLTTAEAEKFWPLYNDFDSKQEEIRRQKVRGLMDLKNNPDPDKMTEKEASALLDRMESNEDQSFQNRKKFIAALRPVLPAVKIVKLKKAEEDFNRDLLKQYREKRRR